jgi:hypothetical protein
MEYKYVKRDTVIEGKNQAFYERMRQNTIRMTEFFEENGVGEPARQMLPTEGPMHYVDAKEGSEECERIECTY